MKLFEANRSGLRRWAGDQLEAELPVPVPCPRRVRFRQLSEEVIKKVFRSALGTPDSNPSPFAAAGRTIGE